MGVHLAAVDGRRSRGTSEWAVFSAFPECPELVVATGGPRHQYQWGCQEIRWHLFWCGHTFWGAAKDISTFADVSASKCGTPNKRLFHKLPSKAYGFYN